MTKSIKDGSTAHQQKQFAIAAEMLESEITSISDPVEYAQKSYLLGDCYKNLNDSEKSLKWYIEAAKNDFGPQAYWEMSYALKKNERYEDAILSFQRLLKYSDRKNDIKLEIEKCRKARKWKNSQGEHEYILEALTLNSPESDFSPAIWRGDFLVFTSDRVDQIDGEKYNWTGNSFSDLFVSQIGEYGSEPFDNPINTPANEGTACFNKTGNIMFFSRCFSEAGDSYCRILKSELQNGVWTSGEEAFSMKPQVNYTAPALIENDEVLIFTSDDPTGFGQRDLYYSLLEDGYWSAPELMPSYLNSIGDERFPTWHDGSLYYSSDHFAGLGGLDIFKTTLNDDGSWTRPENVLAPINSSEDDYSYVVVPKDKLGPRVKSQAYFTSTRGIYGSDDIYSITEVRAQDEIEEPDTIAIVEEEIEEIKKNFVLNIKVVEKMYAVPDNPNSYVVGKRKTEGASVRIRDEGGDRILTTDETGMVTMTFDSTVNYDILAGKKDYLNRGEEFKKVKDDLADFPDGHIFTIELELDKIFDDVEVVLDNIYYDFNEFFIRDDAKPSLDQLTKILNENPALSIELSSHTDCRGEADLNQILSENRAKAAVDYIRESGGVESSRLSFVGYGKSKLEIDCLCTECSEDEHQINRRTTFKIIR